MAIRKETAGFGVPWEDLFGYVQVVKVGDTIYVSGQLSHDDEGNILGAPEMDAAGRITGPGDMELQMRQTYANAARILGRFGATLDNVVEEVIYVTDMEAAFAVAGPIRKAAYGSDKPEVASTIVAINRLALAAQLIEVRFVARV